MPLPNLTPETATAILVSALPYTTPQNVLDGGTIHDVYYKITNDVAHDSVVAFWFYGTISAPYTTHYMPDYAAYANVTLVTFVFDAYPNCVTLVPMKAGESYWIRVFQHGSGTISPILNISITAKSYSETYESGNVIIFSASSSDYFTSKGGLPAGVIDPSTSEITNHIPFFPSSEGGDALNDGLYLITDNARVTKPDPPNGQDWYLLLLNSTFTLITRALFTHPTTGYTFEPIIRTNNATNKFWVGQTGYSGAPNRYASVSSTGVISAITSFTNLTPPSTIRAIAATNDESHLLVIPDNLSISRIHKWNLSTLAWDGTIGPVIADAYGNDVLVMADGNIIIVYATTDDKSNIVKRLDLSGTELNTTTITTIASGTAGPRLGYSADPLNFWLWIPLVDGKSQLRKYKASDFSILSESITGNVYETSIETASPFLSYTSDSCPIIEIRTPGGGPPPTPDHPGIVVVVEGKRRDIDEAIPTPTFRTGLLP